MNEARKTELTRIKEEKRKKIEVIQEQINQLSYETQRKLEQLNKSLRIAVDEHNRAAWCIEELDRLENPSVNQDKELIETKEDKDE